MKEREENQREKNERGERRTQARPRLRPGCEPGVGMVGITTWPGGGEAARGQLEVARGQLEVARGHGVERGGVCKVVDGDERR